MNTKKNWEMTLFYLNHAEKLFKQEKFEKVLQEFFISASNNEEIFFKLFQKFKNKIEKINFHKILPNCCEKIFELLIDHQIHMIDIRNGSTSLVCDILSHPCYNKKVLNPHNAKINVLFDSLKKNFAEKNDDQKKNFAENSQLVDDQNSLDVVHSLVNHFDTKGMAPLFYAAKYSNTELFFTLIENGFLFFYTFFFTHFFYIFFF